MFVSVAWRYVPFSWPLTDSGMARRCPPSRGARCCPSPSRSHEEPPTLRQGERAAGRAFLTPSSRVREAVEKNARESSPKPLICILPSSGFSPLPLRISGTKMRSLSSAITCSFPLCLQLWCDLIWKGLKNSRLAPGYNSVILLPSLCYL